MQQLPTPDSWLLTPDSEGGRRANRSVDIFGESSTLRFDLAIAPRATIRDTVAGPRLGRSGDVRPSLEEALGSPRRHWEAL